jgi:hypothetical protein
MILIIAFTGGLFFSLHKLTLIADPYASYLYDELAGRDFLDTKSRFISDMLPVHIAASV